MKDLKNRLSKARGAFIKLRKIWSSKAISRRTKLRLYKTLVVPVLLYGCETWKMNKGDNKAVDVFLNKCLRTIFNIQWQDHISTEELLRRANMNPLSEEVKWRRWKMIGHIPRQDQNNDGNTAIQKEKEDEEDRRPLGAVHWRRREKRRDGHHGWKQEHLLPTGDALWRPYVP